MEFQCIEKCVWEVVLNKGDTINVENKEVIPASIRNLFIEETREGERLANKINKMGHLQRNLIEKYQDEADALKIAYSRQWSAEKMSKAVKMAKTR